MDHCQRERRTQTNHCDAGRPGARPPEQEYRNGLRLALSASRGPLSRGVALGLHEPWRRTNGAARVPVRLGSARILGSTGRPTGCWT